MKTIFAAIALTLIAAPALADHADVSPLYHQVTANVESLARGETQGISDFEYAPLYVTVRGAADQFAGEEPVLVMDFSYSPLYLQVTMGNI